MKNIPAFIVIALVPVLLLVAVPAFCQQPEDAGLKFFRDLAETRRFTLGRPVKPALTPDGSAVIFLRGGARSPVMRLYEMQVGTGKVEELLTPEALLRGAEEKLTVEERARRERMRVSLKGFTDFDLSEDGTKVLVTLSGRLYVVNRAGKRVLELPGEWWIDPGFSRDGNFVAAVRNGELFVIDLAAVREKQITVGATETLTHGLAEFAAEEEMDRHHGYWWSPDSKWIVFQETDVSMVEKHYIADPLNPGAPPQMYFYPRAGTANARVRLALVSRVGGAPVWIHWDDGKYPYLARVVWEQAAAPLTLLVQTRDQREEKLLTVNPATGDTHELFTETDADWIDLDPDNRIPFWLKDGSAFLWTTQRRGGWQLELRGRDGNLVRELTPADCECAALVDADEERGTVITSGGPDPREEHLFRVSLSDAAPERITQESGSHFAVYSKDHGAYVHTFDLADGRWGMQVRNREGKALADVPSVAEKPPFLPRIEFTQVGQDPSFYALLIRPHDFDPSRKYPVILDVYAGPTATVVHRAPLPHMRDQWFADSGFIVVSLDNRGTPGRGRAWERTVKGNLIDVALQDQVAGLQLLGAKYPELDLSRVGVSGWSFGGYFAAMATIRRPDVFKCGVAGAPVVDWEDYDTHYTERYMDLPSANPEGYRKANVLTYAGQLERPLLLVHGLVDDNVYVVHTLKLARALFEAGRRFELLPLLTTHMVPEPVVSLRLESRILDFFKTHL